MKLSPCIVSLVAIAAISAITCVSPGPTPKPPMSAKPCQSPETPVGDCFSSGWCIEDPLGPTPIKAFLRTGPDTIWISAGPGLEHWNGSAWSLDQNFPSAFSATGPDDVWEVGRGMVRRWDGSTWTVVDGPSALGADRVYAAAPNDVFVVSDLGARRWDGSAWTNILGPSPALHVSDVSGTGPTDVWFASGSAQAPYLQHWDGAALSAIDLGPDVGGLYLVRAYAPNDAWVVGWRRSGPLNYFAHWNGASWTPFSLDPVCGGALPACGVADVWSSGPNNAWILPSSDCKVWHWDGQTLSATTICDSPGLGSLTNLFGASASDLYASGSAGVFHFDGTRWAEAGAPIRPSKASVVSPDGAAALWGAAECDVWAVGSQGAIAHRDSMGWSTAQSGTSAQLAAVHGSAANDVWAVGQGGTALHWDGSTWKETNTGTTADLVGVHSASTSDAWAIGGKSMQIEPALLHWDGAQWSSMPLPAPLNVTVGVWGAGANDVWLAGREVHENSGPTWVGDLFHWDGSTWTPVALPSGDSVAAFSGTAAHDLWAVGDTVLHWDGSTWTSVPSPSLPNYHPSGVHAVASNAVFTTGFYDSSDGSRRGILRHWDGTSWSDIDTPLPAQGVWAPSNSSVWVLEDPSLGVGSGAPAHIFHKAL